MFIIPALARVGTCGLIAAVMFTIGYVVFRAARSWTRLEAPQKRIAHIVANNRDPEVAKAGIEAIARIHQDECARPRFWSARAPDEQQPP